MVAKKSDVGGPKMEHSYQHNIWQKLVAEVFGTSILTFSSIGSLILYLNSKNEVHLLGHLVAPALVIVALTFALGNVSGAHFNPIVTIAFFVRGVFSGVFVAPYIVAQLVGAFGGNALAEVILGNTAGAVTKAKTTWVAAGELEFVLSSLLVIVILSTASRHRVLGDTAGLAVGSTLLLCSLLGFSISGASLNPARSLAPAILNGDYRDLWIYLVFPLSAAIFAALLTRTMHWHRHTDEKTASEGE